MWEESSQGFGCGILELGGMSVTERIGGGRVVATKGSGRDIIWVDIFVLECCSSVSRLCRLEARLTRFLLSGLSLRFG